MQETYRHREALGQSEAFLDFQEKLSRVAPIDRPVLLLGERGTGKELAAARLHFLSRRWEGPFITLNCATLTPGLIEAELFGHAKGAFTGAETSRAGRFEAAHGGTLFLDEIGTIPLVVQEKILRVVEYSTFERVGSADSIEVDVRIVCATNADLIAMCERGEFKRDLLDRLSFEVLFLPPLRHREEDILLLANHFAARMAFELERPGSPEFSDEATTALLTHPWPGNIRELKNVVERAVYKADAERVTAIEFDPFTSPYSAATPVKDYQGKKMPAAEEAESPLELPLSLKETVKEVELNLLNQALTAARHNRKKAARMLGLTYDQLRGLLKKYRRELAS